MRELEIHIGQAVENDGDVAIAIAPLGTQRGDLLKHGHIIAMSPAEARRVASLIEAAADAADTHRRANKS